MAELHARVRMQSRDRFGRFKKLLDEAGTRSTQEMAEFSERAAKGFAPVDTGELRAKIRAYMRGTRQFDLESNAGYAKPVEEGSAPHQIPGAFGRDDGVEHPGSGAQPYLRPTVRALQGAAPGILRKHYPG